MKNKKVVIISIIVGLLAIIGVSLFFILTKEDKDTTLTILDKQWIESHKNNLIDIEIETDVPVFNYNGQGVFFDFLNDFEKNVGLEFNKVSIKENSSDTYAFKIVDKASKDDILVYQDNYVLVSKKHQKYASLNSVDSIMIGVLETELENANKYLTGSNNISLKPYKNVDSLFKGLEETKGEDDSTSSEVDAIIVLKNLNLDDILENELYINYNLSDYTKDYVITLGKEDKLNSIIKKYYNKWKSEKYDDSYHTNFSESYFTFNGITDKEKVSFEGKQYTYGFVVNPPYDQVVDSKLLGINASILRNFSKLTGVKIEFNEYKKNEELVNKFNENKIDLFFNSTDASKFDMDIFKTNSTYDERVVYLSSIDSNIVINSIHSLENYKVKTLKGSKINAYLEENNITTKKYNNMQELIKSVNTKNIIAIDKETYNYYMRNDLSNFKISFEEELPYEYNFVIRDISDNEIFAKYFDFYLSFIDEKVNVNEAYNKLYTVKSNKNILIMLAVGLLSLFGVIFIISNLLKLLLKLRKNKDNLSKEQKIKYVDMLTSLKNRNYLNDNIEKWDNSEVYPQTIIVIDLNNVAYINDNYGHQEGDNLIKEAANILIKSQVSNTEIIRTNGNEFLIYMVGYDEKQVVSYIRKLNKELKDIAHGFGAAIGYSIINDAIKTIDDAVNEATIDMRNNKEEVQN